MFARYVYYADHAQKAAFLWTPASGIAHANALARTWLAGLIPCNSLTSAASKCFASQRADVALAVGGSFLLLPLIEAGENTLYVFGIEGYDLGDAPRLLHDLYESPRHFSHVVHLLPQIVLTAHANGDFDYASDQWYRVSGSGFSESQIDQRLQRNACDPETFLSRWRTGVQSGDAFDFEFRLRTMQGIRWYEVRAVPAFDEGRLRKWIVTLDNVDELVHTREQLAAGGKRLEALSDIGGLALNHDLSDDELLQKALGCASKAIDGLWLASFEVDGHASLVAHQTEARLFARVFKEPRPTESSATAYQWNDEAPRPVLRVPFRIGGELQPGLAVIGRPGAPQFDELDEHLVRDVAWRIETALGNLLTHRREAHIATVLQTALLPLLLPQSDELSLDAAYRSADAAALVGGDWYDGFLLPDGRVALSIGDVAGHGLNAAFAMGHVRELVRTAAMQALSPKEVFTATNQAVRRTSYGLVSSFLGFIDPLTLEMRYSVAGHPPPFLVSPDGTVEIVEGSGEILGSVDEPSYEDKRLSLAEPCGLVLYTDGMIEYSRDAEAGEAALVNALAQWGRSGFTARASDLLTGILSGMPILDDAAMLIVRTQPLARFDVVLPAVPATAHQTRATLRRALAKSPLGTRAEEFVLAVCEAVNNAIEHGSPAPLDRVHITFASDETTVHARIASKGAWRRPVPKIERGRGLMLMRALCDRVNLTVGDRGTVVDLAMDLPSNRRPQVVDAHYGHTRA